MSLLTFLRYLRGVNFEIIDKTLQCLDHGLSNSSHMVPTTQIEMVYIFTQKAQKCLFISILN